MLSQPIVAVTWLVRSHTSQMEGEGGCEPLGEVWATPRKLVPLCR